MNRQETLRPSNPGSPALSHQEVRRFYDDIYYRGVDVEGRIPSHLRRLAVRLGPWEGRSLLDIGCGTGQWLMAAAERGAVCAGVDISRVAVEICGQLLPDAEIHCGPAEGLPFKNKRFDVVTCNGSLEHFLDPVAALREMVRVAKGTALFLFLVPNAGFLLHRLGLFGGTHQAEVREEVRTLAGWEELFDSAGLRVMSRWRDLHLLSWSWIGRGKGYHWPLRAAQALALPFWPISWQYQVYHLCRLK